jgi:hypothetical protein
MPPLVVLASVLQWPSAGDEDVCTLASVRVRVAAPHAWVDVIPVPILNAASHAA